MKLRPLLLLAAVFTAPASAFEAHDDSPDAPALSPQEERAKFHLPPGFEIQLVAAEDQIAKPLNLNFDAAGRLWVTSTQGYPWAARTDALGEPIPGFDKTWEEMAAFFKVPADGNADADAVTPPDHGGDTVRVLSDFGPDGKARSVRVFADGLNIPIGIQPLPRAPGEKGDSVIVHSIPSIWKLSDTDGDGTADRRERLYTGLGFKDTHGMSSNYELWYDGWIYGCHGFANHSEVRDQSGRVVVVDSGNTYRFRPDGSRFEIYSYGQTNPFGLADDDHGDFYTCDSHSRPAMLVLPGGCYEGIGKQPDGLGFAPRIMEHDHGSSAIAGLAWYGAEQFPAEFRGNTFNGNPVTHRVNRDRYEWRGSSPQAVEMPDFLSCDDPWFRPVQVKLGPDGALYIADFYNSIIGHYEMPLTDPRRDHCGRGRIWRIVWKGEHGEAPLAALPDLSRLDERGLTARLGDPNLTVRRMAVNELAMRTGGASLAAVNADPAQSALVRTLAAFVLRWSGKEGQVDPANADSAASSLALRVLGEKESWTAADQEAVRRALSSVDARTRRSTALAIARHPEGLLNDLLEINRQDDPQLDYALRLAMREGLSRPGGYAELKPDSDAASQFVADVSLAVNSPESARALLDHLRRTHFHAPGAGEHLRKALLDLPDADTAGLEGLLPALIALPAAEQIPLAVSMAGTLAAKGGRAPGAFTDWMKATLLLGMQSSGEKAAVAVLGAVRDLRDASFREPLEGIARDVQRSPATRVAALQGIAVLPGALDSLKAALKDPAINVAAATLLRGIGDPAANEALLEAMPGAAGEFASELAVGLTGDDASTGRFFDLIDQGKAAATLLRKAPVAGNLANRSQALRDRAAELAKNLPAEDARLDGVIAARAKAYLGGTHDPRHGAEVFAANCTACHRLHGEGGAVGPNLDGIRSRGAQRLIEDILDPNRNVDPLFRVAVLQTTDGATITATNLRQESDFLAFTDLAGKPGRLPLASVKSRGKPSASPMPPAFESVLPPKDFDDLLAYLLAE